tara:strand:- start:2292 stop:2615 length:324 start_codon:yes stop_codon:yes gene_type:complete
MKKKEKPNISLSNKFVELFQKEVELAYLEEKVEHPKHYTRGKVECIDACEAAAEGAEGKIAQWIGHIIRYVWRFRFKHKDPMEDLLKAKFYLNKLIEHYAQDKTKDK